MKSRLRSTQIDLVDFTCGVVKPLGKIELEVVFGNGGLFRRVMINFTVVRAPSPYNVILGRTRLKTLRAVFSTIHYMVKFPTPKGIATLVTRTMIMFECRRLEKEQMVEREAHQNTLPDKEAQGSVDLTEETLVNLSYLDQLVTIRGNLSEGCKKQLIALLKRNLNVFAWEPADMIDIPRRIIEHILNVNPSVEPIVQKRRVLASDRSHAVTKEVEEWVKAGIVRLVRYPTWISNPVLVKKYDGSWRTCIDFKNLNSACPKDYYPLSDIDGKIEAVVGRKAHLLEDKQIPSVGVFDEVFSTWMAFGGNTRDLGSFGEETDKTTALHQDGSIDVHVEFGNERVVGRLRSGRHVVQGKWKIKRINFRRTKRTEEESEGGPRDNFILQLCYNQLSGSIPTQLGSMKKLSVLSLQSNNLSGALPASLGNLGELRRLDLSFNRLFGSIPTRLADAPMLNVLDVRNNTLSGSVPLALKRLAGGFQYGNNLGLCGVEFAPLRTCSALDKLNPNGVPTKATPETTDLK
ncbi:reverse transcriptase domain-containing protein [Tanacetum coccineum]